jgi:hypothetical protein
VRLPAWPALVAALLVPVETSFVPVAYAQDVAAPATGQNACPPALADGVTLADVHVAANTPDVQLLARVQQGDVSGFGFGGGGIVFGGETRDYAILCTAPCDVKLPLGGMRFALSHEGGSAVETADPLVLRGPATLRATYESRRGIRLAGIGVLLAGIATATILLAVGESRTPCGPGVVSAGPCYNTHFAPGYFAGGVAALTVGTAAGIVMMLMKDKASLELVPMVSARPLAPRGVASDSRGIAGDSSGMGLRLTF